MTEESLEGQDSLKFEENKKAYLKTVKGKASVKKYRDSPKGKEAQKKFAQSDKFKQAQRKYYYGDKGQEAHGKAYAKQKWARDAEKWIELNPGKTITDYIRKCTDEGTLPPM